jgi:hypothetical protein
MIIGNHNFNKNNIESEIKDNDFEEINQEISKALIDMKIENLNEKNNKNENSFNFPDFDDINNSYNSNMSNSSFSNKSSPNLRKTNNFYGLSFQNNLLNNSFNSYQYNQIINYNNYNSFQFDFINNSFSGNNYKSNYFFNNCNYNNLNYNILNNLNEKDINKLNYNNNECLDSPKNIIHLDNVLKLKDKRTTIMIRHIPNRYNLNLLMKEINYKFSEKFDVLYLPLDITNNSNLGFGFINFTNSMHVLYFFFEFNNKKWNQFNSGKRCHLVYAKTQGKKDLIKYIQRKNGINIFSNNSLNSCKNNYFYIQNDSLDLRADIEIPMKYYNVFVNYYPYSLCHKKDEYTFIVDKYYNF